MQPRGSVGNRGSNVPVGGLGYSDTEVNKRKAVGNNIDKKHGIVHEHVLYCMYIFLI